MPRTEAAIWVSGSSSQHLLSWASGLQGFVPPQTHKGRLEPEFPTVSLQTLPPPLMEQKILGKKELSDSHPTGRSSCLTNTAWCPRTGVFQDMCLLATMSNPCTPRALNFFLGIRAVLSLPVKVFPYKMVLGNALPQADISNLAISPRLSLKAENCFTGTPEVQVRFVLTLPHAREFPHCH